MSETHIPHFPNTELSNELDELITLVRTHAAQILGVPYGMLTGGLGELPSSKTLQTTLFES